MTLETPIKELMTKELVTLKAKDCIADAKNLFNLYPIHHLPVIGEDQDLIGMISKSDFSQLNHALTIFNAAKFEAYNQRLHQSVLVDEIMTTNLLKLEPEDPIALAIDIFLENNFHAIPVVKDGQLKGIVCPNDILGALKESHIQFSMPE